MFGHSQFSMEKSVDGDNFHVLCINTEHAGRYQAAICNNLPTSQTLQMLVALIRNK